MAISRNRLKAKSSSAQKILVSSDLETPQAPIIVLDNANENDAIARLEFYDAVLTIVYRHQICGKLDSQTISAGLAKYLPLAGYNPQPVDDSACKYFAIQDRYRMHTHIGFALPLNNPGVVKSVVKGLQSIQIKSRVGWQTKQNSFAAGFREKICKIELISDTEPLLKTIDEIYSPQPRIQNNRNCFWRERNGNINIIKPSEVNSFHIPTQLFINNQVLREHRLSLDQNKTANVGNNAMGVIGALLLIALVIGCTIFNCRKNRKMPMKLR